MGVRYQLVIDCADVEVMTGFWTEALGYVLAPPPDGAASWDAWRRAAGFPESEIGGPVEHIVDPNGHGPRIWFHALPDRKTVKNRLHIDVHASGDRATTPAEIRRQRVDDEAKRLAGLGATIWGRLGSDDDGVDWYAVGMKDPEGNEFDIN